MDTEKLREILKKDLRISREIWKSFYDASVYGTAVPMQWLIANLFILYKRVLAGEVISVEGKDFVLNKDTFKSVIEKEFYDISISDMEEELRENQ